MNKEDKKLRLWIRYYDLLVLRRPVLALFLFLIIGAFWITGLKQFRLDASADSLVLEHDDDLRYFREFLSRFESEDFLILTFSPESELFSDESLRKLKALRDDLKSLPRASKVTTILEVPLFASPPVPLSELRQNDRNLMTPGLDREQAKREFSQSPIYKDLLVSEDSKSTALLIHFEENENFNEVAEQRLHLHEKRQKQGALSAKEMAELSEVEQRYRHLKDIERERSRENIKNIRNVVKKHQSGVSIFLGGVPMIVNDMLTYVRSDILIFGFGIALLIACNLWWVFRKKRWVILPMVASLLSVAFVSGILGWMHWDVTVVSSNFISLQLIMAMSFSIHLIGRYREVVVEHPEWDHHALILEAVRTIFVPSSFTCLTTIAGFASLLTCDILPIIDFGWMMIAGLVIALLTAFLVIPISLRFLEKEEISVKEHESNVVPSFFARVTEKGMKPILITGAVVLVVTIVGMYRLEVENSFIKYFKKSTPIYQGMKMIDDKLGGTTPLDIVLTFDTLKAMDSDSQEKSIAIDDDFDILNAEEETDPAAYWFTADKLESIERVHDYLEAQPAVGKVMSLATLLKMMRQIQDQKSFDNFDLALIYRQVPADVQNLLVHPYVSIPTNEARILARVKDSDPDLRRDQFLKKIEADLKDMGFSEDRFRMTSFMVLYNNMLQSLFSSLIGSSLLAAFPLLLMFILVFRSVQIGIIAMIPNLIATTLVLGIMGWMKFPLDMMTITIVSISLGMGVEDTILYIHRFRKEIKKDYDYLSTMRRCHLSVGKSMYHTSVVVTLGFSILVFSHFIPTILFGLLTAVSMVVSLVAALTLLPAIIVLWKPFGNGEKSAD